MQNIDVKKDIRFRVYFSFTVMAIFAIAIIMRVAYIQLKHGDELRAMANRAHTQKETLYAERGDIYSEDGKLLCATIPQFDLRVDFQAINNDTFTKYVDTLSASLSKALPEQTRAQYKEDLLEGFLKKQRYWLLKKNAPYYEYQAVRSMPLFNKGPNKGGLIVESKIKRINPYGMLAYRTIGLWREDTSQKIIGLEATYDTALQGKPGSRIVRKATGGVWMPLSESEITPEDGKDIYTTIDVSIQDVAENALLNIMEKYESLTGTAIVMETSTGKIRALANLGRQKDGSYWEDFNYALIPSEPGSVFKLISLFSLLEDKYVTIHDMVNCNGGTAVFGNQRVVDDHQGIFATPIEHAFAMSSNVAFASLVNKYYSKDPDKFISHLHDLHLDEPTGIDLIGERKPYIKNPTMKSWNKVTSLPWIGYGYESLITPMRTLMVYNAIANNGKMMKPYLVTAIKDYGKDVETFEPTVVAENFATPETIKQLKEAMRAVVVEGTGQGAQSPYYNAAGKTGTAQVADQIAGHTYRYADGVRQGSFVGFFPYENPKYTIAIVIRSKPHGVYYGAQVALPVFRAIADKLYATKIGGWKVIPDSMGQNGFITGKNTSYSNLKSIFSILGVKESLPGINTANYAGFVLDETGNMHIEPVNMAKNTVPNVVGMGLKDALRVLEVSGLKVNAIGAGKVVFQSIPAGDKLNKGAFIKLELA